MGKKKKDGQIFTPKPIVQHMLGCLLFPNKNLVNGHIIDNSCGDGAFLCEIVHSLCSVFMLRDNESLKRYLETYVHGIELDPVAYGKCIKNLDMVAGLNGIDGVKWDIRNCDALSCHDFDGKMDFVIANPPYIRTHDLDCDLTGYDFTDGGMKDIYLAFYELGFRMLKETGTMCYITPSSWFSSGAGQKMRDYIIKNQNLAYVEDYGHTQLFENATTYVTITKFNKEKNVSVEYEIMDEYSKWKSLTVSFEDMCIGGKFYFGTPDQLKKMRGIIEYGKSLKKEDKAFEVKNGYATLADDVFITEEEFRGHDNVIPIIKSSTGKQGWCIYPYDCNGKLIQEKNLDRTILLALDEHREKLDARATNEPWYAFGRTQAINDTYRDKWAIKNIIKSSNDCSPVHAPEGTGVYGGLYILPKTVDCNVENYLIGVLMSRDFMDYVKMLGKYKSGGYYTFSSKELENYLNWTWKQRKK